MSYVSEGWWHPNVKDGQVHDHKPTQPATMHRECELVYTKRTVKRPASAGRLITVDVPMECIAKLDAATNTIVAVTFMPREGSPGYRGPKASVADIYMDGEPVTDDEAAKAAKVWDADWTILANLGDGIEWEG